MSTVSSVATTPSGSPPQFKKISPSYSDIATIGFGGNRGPGKEGTPDTYVDGLTFFGCNRTGLYQPGFADVVPVSERTVRHCIFVMFWNNGHAFMPGGGGRGLWENNIFWGGIVLTGWGILYTIIKYVIIVTIIVLIKNTNPRVRIDQAVRFFWGPVTVLAIIGMVLAIVGL